MSITSITRSVSGRVAAGAVGIAMAVSIFGAAAPASAASLTSGQIQSILSLLQSFGADASTIANVQASLTGGTPTGTTGGTTTGGSCGTFSRDLTSGSTGSDVMALQVFLNGHGAQVSASGAGSPGKESSTFGPATKAALAKWQAANGISPAAGYFGPLTRSKVASMCGGTTGTTGGTTGGTVTPTGPGITVSAGVQPAATLAPKSASRVPFTTFTLSNNTANVVTVNSVTVQRTGLGLDADFTGVELVDANGLQIGISHTLNSVHQANIGDGFTLNPGQSMTYTVSGNMSATPSAGAVVGFNVVAVNTSVPVSGSLPITGTSQTENSAVTIGSVSTTTSSYDPGTSQTKNIGDTNIRFSGIRFTAGSTEDLKLYNVRWRQVGSASSADLANVTTVIVGSTADGSYPATVDSTGKYYTTTFPNGLTIAKGNSIDVYLQGDLVGSNSNNRTVEFDIDKVTDVYFVGQLYGYGIAPSGTFTPWFAGNVTTIHGGTVTTISKANSGAAAAQNIAVNTANQPLGGFTTNFTGEPVSVTQMIFHVNYGSTAATGNLVTNVSIADENGNVVAGPQDATVVSGTDSKVTFTDTVTFPVGIHTYYLRGKIPSSITSNDSVTASTSPSSWTNPTGQTTGNTVSLSGVSTITFNSMTVKPGAITISLSSSPATQTVISGNVITFANVLLDAQASGEDLRMANLPIKFNLNGGATMGSASNLSGCGFYNGSQALNSGSNVVNSLNTLSKTTFTFDNALVVPKGTVTTLALKCTLSTTATSSSQYQFSTDTTTTDYSITGRDSGASVSSPTITSGNTGTLTAGTVSLAFSVDTASPASSTVAAGGSSGVTVGVYNLRATNDDVTLNKLGVKLTAGVAADVASVSFYSASGTLLGSTAFGTGQTIASSTFATPLLLPRDTDVPVTVKATFTSIGTGKSGTEGAVVQIDPSSAEGNGTTGLVQAGGSGTTNGVRTYNSQPTFTYDTTGGTGTLTNGSMVLLTMTISADSQGKIGLNRLTFTLATTTVTLTNPVFSGPNGHVASSTYDLLNNAGTAITVFFDSSSNTSDASVGAGSSKTYTLRATIAGLTGSNSGTVSVALKNESAAVAISQAWSIQTSNLIWSPLSTSTTVSTSTNDWVNGYALTTGCFATVGITNDCTARVISS